MRILNADNFHVGRLVVRPVRLVTPWCSGERPTAPRQSRVVWTTNAIGGVRARSLDRSLTSFLHILSNSSLAVIECSVQWPSTVDLPVYWLSTVSATCEHLLYSSVYMINVLYKNSRWRRKEAFLCPIGSWRG